MNILDGNEVDSLEFVDKIQRTAGQKQNWNSQVALNKGTEEDGRRFFLTDVHITILASPSATSAAQTGIQ